MAKKGAPSADGKKILKALAASEAPLANKQLATQTGLDSKVVSAVVKDLKTAGLVDSPARCKYGVTQLGEKALKG